MTKKYEKFEEWMVGERVYWDGDGYCISAGFGTITERYFCEGDPDMVYVWVMWESCRDTRFIDLMSLEFTEEGNKVEEQNTEQKINWEVGQVVWDTMFGQGIVTLFDEHEQYGVDVEFSKWGTKTFTTGGAFNDGANRTLFFSEPKIEAELFPPKKPFIPKMKFDDLVVVINKDSALVSFYGHVEQELEDRVLTRTSRSFDKYYYSFFKIGEEIKFEEN